MSRFNMLSFSKKLCSNARDESPVVLYMKKVMLSVMHDLYCYKFQKNETRKSRSTWCMTGNVKA